MIEGDLLWIASHALAVSVSDCMARLGAPCDIVGNDRADRFHFASVLGFGHPRSVEKSIERDVVPA